MDTCSFCLGCHEKGFQTRSFGMEDSGSCSFEDQFIVRCSTAQMGHQLPLP